MTPARRQVIRSPVAGTPADKIALRKSDGVGLEPSCGFREHLPLDRSRIRQEERLRDAGGREQILQPVEFIEGRHNRAAYWKAVICL